MEVHHHPDLHHKRKKIKEYFLEFLMIFLAVTLGFFAESLREYIGEKRIEKEFIKSFVSDLKKDTAAFNYVIPKEETAIKGLDTLLNTLSGSPYTDSCIRLMYYLSRKYTESIEPMTYTLRTISQLKYAGGLRLISDKQASDSIISYNKRVDDINSILDFTTHDFMIPSIHIGNKIFNAKYLLPYDGESVHRLLYSGKKMFLLSNDGALIGEYMGLIYQVKQIRKSYYGELNWHRERALDMISFFENKYHLEND
jgi:hypothetical protein